MCRLVVLPCICRVFPQSEKLFIPSQRNIEITVNYTYRIQRDKFILSLLVLGLSNKGNNKFETQLFCVEDS